jgi:hypothetical protein
MTSVLVYYSHDRVKHPLHHKTKKRAAPEDAAQFREETPQMGQGLYMLHRNTMEGGPGKFSRSLPMIEM